ncbi:glycosyltransferase family 2 protein [Patescibacteria group bacterium]|nr:glycosyltransferase family 2 protein [Patescibacteria group bacterium]
MKTVIVIPAYNEESTIAKVLAEVKPLFPNIIVIDDGSTDNTYQIAKGLGVTVLRHMINRGLGGALGTGFQAALLNQADIVVTFDADGQHQVEDISRLIKLIIEGQADVVIGSRMKDRKGMPLHRQLANVVGNLVTKLLFGIWVSDSQSGLRAFSRQAASQININSNEMEVSSEIINEIHVHQLRLTEIPIAPIYTDYSLSKPQGQNFITGLKTLLKLIMIKITK